MIALWLFYKYRERGFLMHGVYACVMVCWCFNM